MPITTRYQVFLSSTFTDLKEERAEVIQALWELDCIPTGMEAFLASNLSQWEIIQRVIDECDYYILIIGGRYGSLTVDDISYTEKEYDYAKKIGLPILSFVHNKPDDISIGKSESSPALRLKLESFRQKVMKAHPVSSWTTAHELGAVASRSLIQEIRRNPRPGWVRNDGNSPIELLQRIDVLTQENIALKEEISKDLEPIVPLAELSSGDEEIELTGTHKLWPVGEGSWHSQSYRWDAKANWNEIFRLLGPALLNESTEFEMQSRLAQFHVRTDLDRDKWDVGSAAIGNRSFGDVIVQLRALGLIESGIKKRGVNDRGRYWRLTDYGDRYLVGLLARRKGDAKAHEEDGDEDIIG